MTTLRHSNAAGQHALDLIGAACISLDARGRVLSMNRRAEALVAGAATLRIKDHRLLAVLPVEQGIWTPAYYRPVPAAMAILMTLARAPPCCTPERGTPLYMSALPYHSSRAFLEDNPTALLFLTTRRSKGTVSIGSGKRCLACLLPSAA